MFIVYFLMGALFTYIALQYADDSIWNPLTILFLLIAAFDFLVAFRTFKLSRQSKK